MGFESEVQMKSKIIEIKFLYGDSPHANMEDSRGTSPNNLKTRVMRKRGDIQTETTPTIEILQKLPEIRVLREEH